MKKVPEMISTKDLSYLEDSFNWNFIACKKANEYSNLVSDKKIQKAIDKVYRMHEKICQALIDILG